MDLLVSAGVFVLVFVGVLVLLASRGNQADQARDLLRCMGKRLSDDISITRKDQPEKSAFFPWFSRINLLRKLEENIWQAGLYMPLSEILAIVVLLFSAGMAAARAFSDDASLSLATGLGLSVLPLVYIRMRKKRRLQAFCQQLPSALDMIKSSLEAGHSLQRSLQVVVGEFGDPLGGEFRTALEQTRIGLPLPRALAAMLKRVPEDDLRILVVAVRVQSEVGSSLAQIVGRLSEIVRTRQRLRLQVRALTAQSRMGGLIVGLLPAIILALFSLMQPAYSAMLFHDPSGQMILKVAAIMDLLALVIIRKLVAVKY